MPKLIIPFLIPVKFHEATPVQAEQYRSRHMDIFSYYDTIREWDEHTPYCQKWQQNDTIPLQIHSSYSPLTLKTYNEKGLIVQTQNVVPVMENAQEEGLFIYELAVALAAYPEGCYYFQLEGGNPLALTLVSEPFFVKELQENTLLLEYNNYRFSGSVIFETGYSPNIRIEAANIFKTPASKDTYYEDQVLNMTQLNSVSYRLWELIIGGSTGIPDYLIDKVNRILGCSSILIDGKAFSKNEGAKLEPKEIDGYPMRGWSIELREKVNRDSRIYENDFAMEGNISVVANVDSKGFGNDTSGGNVYSIIDVE